jgi:hypothetical protein
VTPPSKHFLRVLLVACALLVPCAATAPPAAVADTACWVKLLNDWYDGRIDNVYPLPCYEQAIKHLPTDVDVYSSARDDIRRALALASAHEKNPKAPLPTITTRGPGAVKGASSPGRTKPEGPIPTAIDSSSKGGATSFPLPLLILGGLALFLLAAGVVGLIVRRMQGRGGPPAA